MVRQFRVVRIMEVVDYVAMHFRDRGTVLNTLRGKECFAGYDVVDPDTKWTDKRVKEFVVDVCRIAEQEPPPSAKVVFLYDALKPTVDAFLRGETEEDDFYQLSVELASDNSSHFDRCIDYVETRCSSLATYLAARGEVATRPASAGPSFVPACARPFNAALHELPLPDDVVLKGTSELRGFESTLKKSRYFRSKFIAHVRAAEHVSTSLRFAYVRGYITMRRLFSQTSFTTSSKC